VFDEVIEIFREFRTIVNINNLIEFSLFLIFLFGQSNKTFAANIFELLL